METNKEQIKQLKEELVSFEQEKELAKRLYNIRIKDSSVLNPNFGFEKTREYQKYLVDKSELELKRYLNGVDHQIERVTKAIEVKEAEDGRLDSTSQPPAKEVEEVTENDNE